MDVPRFEDAGLADYTVHAYLAPGPNGGLPLRMVSLLHRRGVLPVELWFMEASTAARGEFAARFRTTASRAHTIKAGFESLVYVEDVSLTRR